jgi:DNA invertase Pin-like site-specific DNA recombinase
MRALIYARQSVGNEKSIDDQVEECTVDVREQGWELFGVRHDGSSASRLARKARANWPGVLKALEAREFDVLVLWESSRGDRDAETWLGLLRVCRNLGVLIRVVKDEYTYDVRLGRDWEFLASQGVKNAMYSEETRDRALKGIRGAVRRGHPPMGPAPYGYRREYDRDNGAVLQLPDDATAPVVREIFERVGKAEPLVAICRDLDARGIPTANGAKAWRTFAVRKMCTNPAYVARRRHKGTEEPGNWEPIIEERLYQDARRVLMEPARLARHTHARPGRYVHLLSFLATCGECGGRIYAQKRIEGKQERRYGCVLKACFFVNQDEADALIVDLVIGRLSSPDIYARLRRSGEDASGVIRAAENEIAELRGRLETWRASAAKGQTTPETMAAIETQINADILAAEKRRDAAALPEALAGWPGPIADVKARWADATIQARRTVVRSLVKVEFLSAKRQKGIPVHDRIRVEWI